MLSPDYKKKLELKENSDRGVYVANLSQHAVHSVTDCQTLMENGWKNRAVGATLMNADSSRSHSIFSISVEMMDTALESLNGEKQHIRRGKLNLVDLAGSERQSKTGYVMTNFRLYHHSYTVQFLKDLLKPYKLNTTTYTNRSYWRPFEGSY